MRPLEVGGGEWVNLGFTTANSGDEIKAAVWGGGWARLKLRI